MISADDATFGGTFGRPYFQAAQEQLRALPVQIEPAKRRFVLTTNHLAANPLALTKGRARSRATNASLPSSPTICLKGASLIRLQKNDELVMPFIGGDMHWISIAKRRKHECSSRSIVRDRG